MSGLIAEHLKKSYPTSSEPLEILRDVSLSLEAGQNVAIVGPSGSGKSTLLAILGSLDLPTSGILQVDGVDPLSLNEKELAAYRADQVGFVFQEHHLLPQCTVLENVLIPFLATRTANAQDVETAKSLLERVGLAERLTHRPAELSGGERQRVALARALVRDPPLLLADEPTGSLDQSTADAIAELLLELQGERQKMLVVVTHSQSLAAKMQRRCQLDLGVLEEVA
ncbi:ABC transporter ATP-binding protein [Adhaeretor mobilis]|uniref:Lipoprotein-releasing system ATP-binding protein LolD n=1 Tax=Adhaeretor mobilis TaxID=1930276 RepID=A0A517N201_9BACT|nr:ABC transporter ATP-binding protein [Adhaeretor mobilis]QDT01161.1 Lipoprotein-releasing system ATP-binding protein LolD [Adhaeretor mobilis]